MAPWKTEGAREVQAEWPWCLARRWTFQGRVRTWGSMGSSRPAGRLFALQRARERGAPGRAVLGEAPARDEGVERGVGREWPAPGRQDAGETREVGPDQARVSG